MSKKAKQIISLISAIMFCNFAFAAMTFFTLTHDSKSVVEPKSDVRVIDPKMESAGFLFKLSYGSVFINFDFVDYTTSVMLLNPDSEDLKPEESGYIVFKRVNAEYDFLSRFIDRFGGLEISGGEGTFCYTGVQITQKLQQDAQPDFKRCLIEKLMKKIADRGLSKDDLAFIIENTESSLNFPEGYVLLEPISTSVKNIHFIN